MPVLLSAAGSKAADAALAKVSVPARRGIRTATKSLKASELRIGDRVTAVVSRVSKRPRASVLRVGVRGKAPSFARLTKRLAAATTSVKNAISSVDQIKANPMTLLDPANPAKGNAELRAQFLEVRSGLNLLVSDLRASAAGTNAAITAITAASPSDARRKAAVAAEQAKLLSDLSQSADSSRIAATQLETAVTRLDESINAIGGASSPSVGINQVGTVSDILHAVLELLRDP